MATYASLSNELERVQRVALYCHDIVTQKVLDDYEAELSVELAATLRGHSAPHVREVNRH